MEGRAVNCKLHISTGNHHVTVVISSKGQNQTVVKSMGSGIKFSSVQFSRSVVSYSLRSHELQHALISIATKLVLPASVEAWYRQKGDYNFFF